MTLEEEEVERDTGTPHREPSVGNEPVQMPTRSPRLSSQRSYAFGSAMNITQDEIEMMLEEAEKEDYRLKTRSRRLVEGVLQKFRWYFPNTGKPNAPSLSKAWAYYEHITLARHFVGDQTASHAMQRAEPGQRDDPDKGIHTELYPLLKTPESSLNQWGLGVGLYFSTLRIMSIILLLTGLINIANIVYYSSEEYSSRDATAGGLKDTLYGSAICTRQEWVVCTTCNENQWSLEEEQDRFVYAVSPTGVNTTLVRRNDCQGAQLDQGIVNWVSLIFLIILMGLLAFYQRLREIRFDEDKLTSTDYSVVVKNPPKDALDPDEWHDFFSQFAEKQVTVVTVALDNDQLLRKLIQRRIFRHQLQLQLPKNFDMGNEDAVRAAVAEIVQERESEPTSCLRKIVGCTVLPILRIFNMFLLPETLVDKIFEAEADIKELQKKKYNACQVFVTFETEEGQRAALSALSVSRMDIIRNNTHNVAPSAIFKGRVLKVREPTEPNAVRWMDLHIPAMRKLTIRLINLAMTVGLIALSGYIINWCRIGVGAAFAAFVIACLNTVMPLILKILMIFERHATEGSWQKSLYLKITIFRWTNTAIMTKIITPFTSTINDGKNDVLPSINAILWAELWIPPLLRLIDIMGNLKKHVLAPRARTQDAMNSWFQGTPYNLGERYTDFTKVVFLVFFYSALYPATFFFGFGILVVQYYMDKFCLLRIWASAPFIGSEVAVYSRRYFFSSALLALALVSSYAYAQFPYDNVCDPDDATIGVDGIYTDGVALNGTEDLVITVKPEQDSTVVYCSQSLLKAENRNGFIFPATSNRQGFLKWMTSSQETTADIYGITSVVVLAVFVVAVFGGFASQFVISFFRGTYKPQGGDQKIDFSTNPEIFAYVPQIKFPGYPFPFLACDVDNIDDELIGWTDPNHSRDYHNLIYDIPYDGMKRSRDEPPKEGDTDSSQLSERPIFSQIKHWPPEWAKKEKSVQD